MLRRLMQTSLAVAVVAGVASVAYGAIPSSNGTITGCVDSKGVLKVIDAETGDTCGVGKQTLAWNQQGPPGPQGPTGPQGLQGPEGPPGPSDAYFTHSGSNEIKLNPAAGSQTVLSLELPPGQYLVWATVRLFNWGVNEPEFTLCKLDGGTPALEADMVWTHPGLLDGKAVLISPATFSRGGGYVKVVCNSSTDPIASAKINALKVGSLTEK